MKNLLSNARSSSEQTMNTTKKKTRREKIVFSALTILFTVLIVGLSSFNSRYLAEDMMQVQVKEFSNRQYPENPASLDSNYQRYDSRKLNIVRKDNHYFDFILEPTNKQTAKIAIKNIDLNLLIPKAPEWAKKDRGLEVIAFTDREWNRQQVSFPVDSEHIEVIGGDGFEKQNLAEVALARNCLNAGLWEIILSTKDEDGNKAGYYQGWFNLPMGYYKDVFENINNMSYWKHWWKLEHWQDPTGTVTNVNLLRKVVNEQDVTTQFPLDEKIIVAGEQSRKIRTTQAINIRTWKDFYDLDNSISFASFLPPGTYKNDKPRNNEYWRIGKFEKAILRDIKPVGVSEVLQEVELIFKDKKTNEENKLFISGVNIKDLPQLSTKEYFKGLYLPMGIGVPPFYQSYEQLKQNPPDRNPYFSVLLDSQDKWIDHHTVAVDGPVMHLDIDNPELLHLYLLSYERHTLIAHFLLDISTL